MAFDLNSISKGKALKAPRIVLYGAEGIGKSSFAGNAPSPIYLDIEDGLSGLDVAKFPLIQSSNDVLNAISTLYNEDHEFNTLVLDSADWLERILLTEIEATFDEKALAFGKSALILADKWREVLEGLNVLRNERNMAIIIIAHNEIKRFDSPDSDPYDRYILKLQQRSSALVREWADCVLFTNYKTIVKTKEGEGFKKDHSRGISNGQRVIYTSERPAHLAKNRFNLPYEIPLEWNAFAEYLK